MHRIYSSECINVSLFFRFARHYLSEFIVSVTTASVSLLDKSHTWRLDAASSMQKTVALVWDHCRETTAAGFCHSATGCSEQTACNLMLPSAHPTWSMGHKSLSIFIWWDCYQAWSYFTIRCKVVWMAELLVPSLWSYNRFDFLELWGKKTNSHQEKLRLERGKVDGSDFDRTSSSLPTPVKLRWRL